MESITLYDPTMKQAIDSLTNTTAKSYGITKKRAKILVLNALFYNCVSAEVVDQVGFLIDEGALDQLDELGY